MIQTSPIDVRRGLYKVRSLGICCPDRLTGILVQNIVLSGGSTMFKDFGRRLQRDIKHIVDGRIANSEQASGNHMRVSKQRGFRLGLTKRALALSQQSTGVDVNVITHKRQRYAVWYGGSLMASTVSRLSQGCYFCS